jgi:hypothetical protein
MDSGPSVTIKHDSRSPSGLEAFCCLRFWLRGVFKFSNFLWCTTQECTLYVGGPTLPWGSTILGVTQWILVQLLRSNMILDRLRASKLSVAADFGYCGLNVFPNLGIVLYCYGLATNCLLQFLSTIRSLNPTITAIMLLYANRSKLNIHTMFH